MDEMDNYGFSREKMLNLKRVMGFEERRIVNDNECTSDLCLFGLTHLFENGQVDRDEITALVLVTQTPDHFMPPSSAILHGKLGLNKEVLCLDINQGCNGYLYGLFQAFLILELFPNGKVILLNGDTLSRCSCPQDRNIYPLIGDAAAITIIENSTETNDILINIKTDGSRGDWLTIPAGAFRTPSSEKTREVKVLPDGNRRSEEHFYMNGAGVFTFTQTDVAKAIVELFEFAEKSMDEIQYFMFHQPNRFMLKKLSNKLGIPEEKMPSNLVEKYGNSSSATIPITICDNISDILSERKISVCMSGFGSGLSWGTLIMDLGPLQFCDILEK